MQGANPANHYNLYGTSRKSCEAGLRVGDKDDRHYAGLLRLRDEVAGKENDQDSFPGGVPAEVSEVASSTSETDGSVALDRLPQGNYLIDDYEPTAEMEGSGKSTTTESAPLGGSLSRISQLAEAEEHKSSQTQQVGSRGRAPLPPPPRGLPSFLSGIG